MVQEVSNRPEIPRHTHMSKHCEVEAAEKGEEEKAADVASVAGTDKTDDHVSAIYVRRPWRASRAWRGFTSGGGRWWT
jgi:hypothetical protein